MENPSQQKSIIALGPWLQTPVGGYVRAWEQSCLDKLTVDIFGFNAIQIGLPQINALQANRMPNRWLSDTHMVAPAMTGSASSIVLAHDFSELPFASHSLDLVVLPHVLEFAEEPHQVLREVERVLMPEGQLIVCGFNPASLWGARQYASRLSGTHFLPQDGGFISMPRLKDWLKLLNMRVSRGYFGCYAPPCKSDAWRNRFSFMEKAGERWWPYLGAVYMLQAVKRIKGMRLVGPALKKQRVNAPQGVPATNKMHNDNP